MLRIIKLFKSDAVQASASSHKAKSLVQSNLGVSLNAVEEFEPSLTPEEKAQRKQFLVYRSNPSESNNKPRFVSYYVDLKTCNPMYLDALIRIKDTMDSTLTFRRSCREGVCGSCAMSLDGKTTLACITEIDSDTTRPSVVTPLGHMYVVKDLVVDMTNFYNQYRSIQPYLKRKTPKADAKSEHYQSEEDRKKLDGLYECVLCASCTTSCPSYWWKADNYLGPATLMQAYRWIVDSRDEYTQERLDALEYQDKADACQNIGMCSATCPKGLNPKKALQDLLALLKDSKHRQAKGLAQ